MTSSQFIHNDEINNLNYQEVSVAINVNHNETPVQAEDSAVVPSVEYVVRENVANGDSQTEMCMSKSTKCYVAVIVAGDYESEECQLHIIAIEGDPEDYAEDRLYARGFGDNTSCTILYTGEYNALQKASKEAWDLTIRFWKDYNGDIEAFFKRLLSIDYYLDNLPRVTRTQCFCF